MRGLDDVEDGAPSGWRRIECLPSNLQRAWEVGRFQKDTPDPMKRACQRQTVVLEVSVGALLVLVPTVAAGISTIMERQACFFGLV